MKVIVSKDVVSNCCELCVAYCLQEGVCPCDVFRYKNDTDSRVAECGDVYFADGEGIEYIGFDKVD